METLSCVFAFFPKGNTGAQSQQVVMDCEALR